MEKETEYDKQAREFLEKTGTSFKAEFLKYDKYFYNDKEKRDIYNITLQRGEREYKFTFGQSIAESGFKTKDRQFLKLSVELRKKFETLRKENKSLGGQYVGWNSQFYALYGFCLTSNEIRESKAFKYPKPYDVLACLTKYDSGTFENFCSEFGYEEDSRNAEKIYFAVCKEYENIQRLYNENEMDLLREIN